MFTGGYANVIVFFYSHAETHQLQGQIHLDVITLHIFVICQCEMHPTET